MTISEYDIQFTRLSRYAPHLVSTEEMKVKRFVNGLRDYLFRSIHFTETMTYTQVLDAALRFESRVRERQVERESRKRPRSEGGDRPRQGGPSR